ncbi:MAG: ABC transporter permease [Acidobacteria bacterium]|nr:ABC transporter permease [Acidobacteriota bacterium]
MGNDIRLAFRTLTRTPLFTAVAVISLALGVGANSAVFSLVDQLYLRPPPVRAPEELVLVKDPGPYGKGKAWSDGDPAASFSHPVFTELRAASRNVLADLAARWNIPPSVAAGKRGAELVDGELVSGNYFEMLGVRAAAGRLLTDDDDRQPGAHPVVVLSYAYWQRQFGRRADIVGSEVRINTLPMMVVGVAPREFTGTQTRRHPVLYLPMSMKARMTPGNDNLKDRTDRWLQLIGRLRPGVTTEQATAALASAFQPSIEATLAQQADLPQEIRDRVRQRRLSFEPGSLGRETLRRDSGEATIVLLGMTGLVLLGACVNVANLMIARGASRAREVSIRFSLGAPRSALVRQMLTESLMMSVAGGLLGMVTASWALAGLQQLVPQDAQAFLAASLDSRALGATMLIAVGTGLVFGLLPALQSTRAGLHGAMKDQSAAGTAARSGVRFRRLLVAVPFALSLVLVVAGGLLAASLANLSRQSPGFDVERVLSFRLDATLSGYRPGGVDAVYARLRERLAALPSVRDVGVTRLPVLADRSWTGAVVAKECAIANRRGELLDMPFNGVDAGFLWMVGAPKEGRSFTAADGAKAPKVAIVNESFARACFKDRSAVGRTFATGSRQNIVTIVGAVPDARLQAIREAPLPMVHFPLEQVPFFTEVAFYLRSELPPESVMVQIQRAVREVDPALAPTEIVTVRKEINDTLYDERLGGFLALSFAAVAVGLAVVGLYGVLAFMVTRRLPEIGVRVALGATWQSGTWLVEREVLMLAGSGVAIGLPVAWLLSGTMRSMLYGLAPDDPRVFVGAVLLLLVAALAAGFGPSRRAARVDPVRVLRYE